MMSGYTRMIGRIVILAAVSLLFLSLYMNRVVLVQAQEDQCIFTKSDTIVIVYLIPECGSFINKYSDYGFEVKFTTEPHSYSGTNNGKPMVIMQK